MTGEAMGQRVGPRDEDVLPPGWSAGRDEDGQLWVISPAGRAYDRLPAGYEPADIAIFDALLDELGEAAR